MAVICIDDYPQLSALCWNRTLRMAEEPEVLQIYEAGWRFIDSQRLTPEEAEFINLLARRHGNGVLNV